MTAPTLQFAEIEAAHWQPRSRGRDTAAGSSPDAIRLTVICPVHNARPFVGPSLKRLLTMDLPTVASLQVVAVDDRSTDGCLQALRDLAGSDRRIQVVRHSQRRGRAAAIRTGVDHARGDACLIHPPDMQYDPADIGAMVRPMLYDGADAVFGSRSMAGDRRLATGYRAGLADRLVAATSNWFTDLGLTDPHTAYKLVNTELLRSIPLRSGDHGVDVEMASKLAKRRARIFEVPIGFQPRGRDEGGGRPLRHVLAALGTAVRFALVDDIYQADEYGSNILADMQHARRFTRWMADTLRPYLGDRVLEIGAGIGGLTSQFLPRDLYTASDIHGPYLDYLRSYAIGKPYLEVRRVDATRPEDFSELEGRFDTALMVNVLEHVPDDEAALANLYAALEPGGRAVILVPQHPSLYGSLDAALEHRERYTPARLAGAMRAAGFQMERIFDFNRTAVPGWWLNGKLLKRTGFSHVQLKFLEVIMPGVRRLDRALPWSGLSVIGIGRKT